MPAEARRLQIIDLLERSNMGVVSVRDLARHFHVSEMTIRRDLDWLEEHSILTRVHGGAVALQKEEEKPFGDRLQESNPQKISIGWAAAKLVQDGDRIILDAGTTTQQVARNLHRHSSLTVITNNIPIAHELAAFHQIETLLLGGVIKHQELCTVGPSVKQELSVLSADKCFLSAAGFNLRQGITDSDMREVEVKQAMIQAAAEVILVADSSKYGLTKLVRIAPLQAVSKIVTDDLLRPEAVAELEAAGIEVITPERLARQNPAVSSSLMERVV